MKILQKYWPLIVLTISLIAIAIALIAEYFFNILPCQMCLYQRYPYYFIIIFSIIYFLSGLIPIILYYWTTLLSFFVGIFFAIWHIGIERNLLKGPSGCSSEIKPFNSLNDLKDQILKQSVTSCNEITWSFMGFSAATINSLLLITLLIINIKIVTNISYKKIKN